MKQLLMAFCVGVFGFGCGVSSPAEEALDSSAAVSQEVHASCELVRCFAYPQCAAGQHAIFTPQDCCGRCVGPEYKPSAPHCRNIICPMLLCIQGYAVTYSGGDCCGTCKPAAL